MTPSQSVIMAITSGQMLTYTQKATTGTWVADGMSKVFNRDKSLEISFGSSQGIPHEPILIKAPTGTGKTYFIEKVLTEIAKQNRGCVLMFVNRTALVRQILNDSCKLSLGYSYSSDSMNGINQINNLIVLTYQQFAGDLNTVLNNLMLPQNIQYVVMDEAHFFTADASFNYQTCNILENILTYSYYKQRIYMSATPENVKNIIAYEENVAQNNCYFSRLCYLASSERMPLIQAGIIKSTDPITPNELSATYVKHKCEMDVLYKNLPKEIHEYSFSPRTYYANVKFFSCWETIIEAITSQDSDEKWLIFVANKDDGTFLNKKLNKISAFVNAVKGSRILEQLEQTAKIKNRVLISTSVLDNGVNIKNDNLHNVVIDSTDYVEFMQMLGRKRVKDNEAINIYVHNKTSFDFESYCKSIEVRITAINSFEKDPYAFIEEQYDLYPLEIRKMFAYDRRYNMRFNNKYLLHCLGQKHSEYTQLQVDLEDDKNAFAKKVCSWLGIGFNVGMIMSEDIFAEKWKKIEPIILSHSKPFDADELKIVYKLFCSILRPNSADKDSDDGRIKSNINNDLKLMAQNGFPYYFVKKEKNMFSFKLKETTDEVSKEESDESSDKQPFSLKLTYTV